MNTTMSDCTHRFATRITQWQFMRGAPRLLQHSGYGPWAGQGILSRHGLRAFIQALGVVTAQTG